MADSDASGATASLNVDNLPNEMLITIFRQLSNQPDRAAAFCEINALRGTSRRFRALIDGDPTIQSDFRTLRQETQTARFRNARIEANNSASTRTANEIITYHGVTDQGTQIGIRRVAAARDIDAGMVAPDAIARNGVTDQGDGNTIRRHAAARANQGRFDLGPRDRTRSQGRG